MKSTARAVENSVHLSECSQVVFLRLICFSLGRSGRFSCCRLCYKCLSALNSLGVSVTRVNLVYAGKHGGRITTALYLLNEKGAHDSSSCSEVFGID